MTLVVAIASAEGFRLVGDKRTVNIVTGAISSETTQKVFYSEKHRIGIAIAGEAELAVNGVSVGFVGDIVKAFLARLDTDDVALIEARLTANGISWILSEMQEHIKIIHGDEYRYAFVVGVDLLLACFVDHKPVIASHSTNSIDLVVLDQYVNIPQQIHQLNLNTFRTLVYCRDNRTMYFFNKITNQTSQLSDNHKDSIIAYWYNEEQNFNSTLEKRTYYHDINELLINGHNGSMVTIEREDCAILEYFSILSCFSTFNYGQWGTSFCFMSNYQPLMYNSIAHETSIHMAAGYTPVDVNYLLSTNLDFFNTVIINAANQINAAHPNNVGKVFDNLYSSCIGGQYSHGHSRFKINDTGTGIVPLPSASSLSFWKKTVVIGAISAGVLAAAAHYYLQADDDEQDNTRCSIM